MEKIKLLLYCTKQPSYLYDFRNITGMFDCYKVKQTHFDNFILNGKIVAECDFEVDTIVMQKGADDKIYGNNGFMGYGIISKNHSFSWYDENKTCLSEEKLFKYLKGKNGYAIHIKNLNIFDKPRELSDYYRYDGFYNNINNWKYIDKAPQNMMCAYELISELDWFGTYNRHFEKKIIISIHPEWLCKILNGEKTIEVRKKVLKEMVKK